METMTKRESTVAKPTNDMEDHHEQLSIIIDRPVTERIEVIKP